jgi:hypothetical protein
MVELLKKTDRVLVGISINMFQPCKILIDLPHGEFEAAGQEFIFPGSGIPGVKDPGGADRWHIRLFVRPHGKVA